MNELKEKMARALMDWCTRPENERKDEDEYQLMLTIADIKLMYIVLKTQLGEFEIGVIKRKHRERTMFDLFSDMQIYILHRQCVESSYEIVCSGRYNADEIAIHNRLMELLTKERKKREIKVP